MWEKRYSYSGQPCAPPTLLQRKSCRYVSSMRLDGPKSQSGCFGDQTDLLSLPEMKPHILVTTLTEPLPTSWCSHGSLIPSKPNPGWLVTTVPNSFHIISPSHNLSLSTSQSIQKNTQSFIKHLLLSSLLLSSSGFGV